MEDKPSINGFLKGFLGWGKPKTTPPEPISPQVSDPTPAPLNTPAPEPPQPRSEAYLNRRKGRKVHDSALGYLKIICPYLVSKGEVSPGEIAKDLGLPKSTLKYNLNTLLDYCHKPETRSWSKHRSDYVVKELLKGHRVVRVGAGKYVRYKLIPVPPEEIKPDSKNS